MAKKKEEEAPAGSPAWMATFSDLMNLLLCFFVLLFSMSSVDAAKYDQVVQSLSAAFSIINTSGGVSITQGQLISSGLSQLPELANYFGDTMSNGKNTKEGAGEEGTGTMGEDESEEHGSTDFSETGISPDGTMTDGATAQDTRVGGGSTEMQQDGGANPQAPLSSETMSDAEISTEEAVESYKQQELSESEKMAQKIESLAAQYGIQDLVQVDFNGQYVRITLNGALLFDSGSAALADEALPLVEKIAKIIEYYNGSITEIEGHTDSVPIHSSRYEDNDVLSMYRAKYVADYIRTHSKVDPANITSSGRGAYVPIADNGTAEGRARNRRVEVKIYNSFNSQGASEEEASMQPVSTSAAQGESGTQANGSSAAQEGSGTQEAGAPAAQEGAEAQQAESSSARYETDAPSDGTSSAREQSGSAGSTMPSEAQDAPLPEGAEEDDMF